MKVVFFFYLPFLSSFVVIIINPKNLCCVIALGPFYAGYYYLG